VNRGDISVKAPYRSIVIGTAGHIDHGKTTLIRALTGIDTDRLPEEKRRGITIDLGFASLDTQSADGRPVRLSFVDVPGHVQFIRNMLAGAGCVDAVMLVIAADEGIKPQTREHFAICRLLGVSRGLTVVTKADAVSETRLEEVCREIQGFVSGTFLDASDAKIIAASARCGLGLDEVREALIALGAGARAADADRLFRLPPDRAFVMKGSGTVVTGTLLAGEVSTGQTLVLEPGGPVVRVRDMQTHGNREQRVHTGSRVALNLTGVDVEEVHRGQMLVLPDSATAVDTIDVEAMVLPGCAAIRHNTRMHFHAFTAETIARVSLYGSHSAEPNTTRLMRLRLQKPVVLFPGDRFVLRRPSPAETVGGGRVLDAHPLANLRKAKSLAWLEAWKDGPLEQQLLARIGRREVAGLAPGALSGETGLTVEAIRSMTQPLVQSHRLARLASGLLLSAAGLQAAKDRIKAHVASREKTSSGSGCKRSELKSQTGLSVEVCDFAVETMAADSEIFLRGELLQAQRPDTQSADQDHEQLSTIAALYEGAGLAAPSTSEVAAQFALKDGEVRRLITILQREGVLIRMGSDTLYMHQAALMRLRVQVQSLRGQSIDVTRFKELTGLSRKYVIPLLEYLDRERVTRKQGDQRLVL
jgi:selenocysteine-specific elongation factor